MSSSKRACLQRKTQIFENEYGWGGVYPAITGAGIDEQHDGKGIRISKGIGSDKPHIDLKWSQVEKRIAELIKLDRYLNPKEKAQYPEWLQRQEERRAELAEERRNREILSVAPSEKAEAKMSNMSTISAAPSISAQTNMKSCPLMTSV